VGIKEGRTNEDGDEGGIVWNEGREKRGKGSCAEVFKKSALTLL